jgi:hypothetical protein
MKQDCMHFIGIRTTIENHFLVKKKKGWSGIGEKAVQHLLEIAKQRRASSIQVSCPRGAMPHILEKFNFQRILYTNDYCLLLNKSD